jgi:hypothetical protein
MISIKIGLIILIIVCLRYCNPVPENGCFIKWLILTYFHPALAKDEHNVRQ